MANSLGDGLAPAPHVQLAQDRRDVVVDRALKTHYMASLRKQPTDYLFGAPDGRGRDHRSTSRAIERSFARAGLDGFDIAVSEAPQGASVSLERLR